MRRTEEHFHTREQAETHLRDALAIVTELDPPEDLRAVVFTQAAQLLAGKQVFFSQQASSPIVGLPGLLS